MSLSHMVEPQILWPTGFFYDCNSVNFAEMWHIIIIIIMALLVVHPQGGSSPTNYNAKNYIYIYRYIYIYIA